MVSNYPSDFDIFPTINALDKANSGGILTHREFHNLTGDSIEALEATLGINPQGSFSTVSERLASIDQNIGALLSGDGGAVSINASQVTIVDAGGYFAGDNVEAALQALGAGGGGGYPSITDDGAIFDVTSTDTIDLTTANGITITSSSDAIYIASPLEVKGIRSDVVDIGSSGSSRNLDLADGANQVFNVFLDQDCDFSFINPPATGLDFEFKVYLFGENFPYWPNSVRWLGGVEPPYAGDSSIYVFSTIDGGEIWYGQAGLGYSHGDM